MNAFEYERKLLDNGFSGKDIAVLRQYLEKHNKMYTEAILDYKRIFIIMCIVMIVIIMLFTAEVAKDPQSLLPAVVSVFIVFPVIFVFSRMRLGWKALCFLKSGRAR